MFRAGHVMLFGLLAMACNELRSEPPDAHLIYAAAMGFSEAQRPPLSYALDPHLMTDEGEYTVAGRLSESVVTYLLSVGAFRELCGYGEGEFGVPVCFTDSAQVAVRFSRPREVHRDTVSLFIGTWNVKPENDTSSFFLPFGMTHRCRVVRRSSGWVRDGCEMTTIS